MKTKTKSALPPHLRPIDGAPRWLNKIEREEYYQIVRASAPGVLTYCDGAFVGVTAVVAAKIREGNRRPTWVRLYKSALREALMPLGVRRQEYRRLGI
jgi:hypothetical protein